MAGLGGLGGGRRVEGGAGQRSTGVVVLCKPPPSHPACLFLLPDCLVLPTCRREKGREKREGKKQHLIRSSYSTSFKGTLNDVFLGRRQLHITSHAQGTTESWRRAGAQDADTAALGMASFLRSEEEGARERRTRRGGRSPSPFFCGGGRSGEKGAVGLRHPSLAGRWGGAAGWLGVGEGGCRRREREFAVIALTGFRAVNDSGLSAYQFVSVLAVY